MLYHLVFGLLALASTIRIFRFLGFITDWRPYIAWLAAINFVAFFMYGIDKTLAKVFENSFWTIRTPRFILHMLSLLGGFLGAIYGMLFFQHKINYTEPKNKWFLPIIAFSGFFHLGLLWLMIS